MTRRAGDSEGRRLGGPATRIPPRIAPPPHTHTPVAVAPCPRFSLAPSRSSLCAPPSAACCVRPPRRGGSTIRSRKAARRRGSPTQAAPAPAAGCGWGWEGGRAGGGRRPAAGGRGSPGPLLRSGPGRAGLPPADSDGHGPPTRIGAAGCASAPAPAPVRTVWLRCRWSGGEISSSLGGCGRSLGQPIPGPLIASMDRNAG